LNECSISSFRIFHECATWDKPIEFDREEVLQKAIRYVLTKRLCRHQDQEFGRKRHIVYFTDLSDKNLPFFER